MTKAQLVAEIAKETGMTKSAAEKVLGAFVKVVTKALKKKDKVAIPGFGTFKVSRRKKRKARVPGTDKIIEVPARTVPRFTPAKTLKDAIK